MDTSDDTDEENDPMFDENTEQNNLKRLQLQLEQARQENDVKKIVDTELQILMLTEK